VSNVTLILILIGAVLVIWSIAVFNSLVRLRIRVQNAWAEIDVQLKRRHDLIPNLVDAVRGYMAHEQSTLEVVTEARTRAVVATGGSVADRSQTESALSGALSNLFAVAERYPQLRAVESVQLLQEQLTSIENRIAAARRLYNDEAMKFNMVQATFPQNILAGILCFSPAAMFSIEDADRANIKVGL
jgi:LemA protein